MGVFLDTSFYLSLVHPKDANAKRGGEILKVLSTGKYGLVYTTNYIMVESATLVVARTLGNPTILADLESILFGEDKIAEFITIAPEIETETWNLFKKINVNVKDRKKIISFVDISSIVICQQNQLDYIISFDEHFDSFLTRIY